MTEVQEYISLPVKIQAMEVPYSSNLVAEKDREEQLRAICKWIINGGGDVDLAQRGKLIIHTPEGAMTASPGDFIIRGTRGEFYPCMPDVFKKKYQLVNKKGEPVPPYLKKE